MTGRRGTPQARLVAQLNIAHPDECWLWAGATMKGGYGQMRYKDGTALVHRVAYEVFIGPIPEGMVVDHECHNKALLRGKCSGGVECQHRRCCNPRHLAAKSQAQNLHGGSHDHSAGEFCANGHQNSEWRHRAPSGQTYCRKCRIDYKAAARAKKREEMKQFDVRPVPGPKKPRARKPKAKVEVDA